MKTIGIFRNQLFKRSEVFIRQQADAISQYSICYIGRRMLDVRNDTVQTYVLNQKNSLWEKFNEINNALTTSPSAYEKILHEQSLELLHAHFAIDGLYGLSLAKKRGIPLVTTLHGFDVTVRKRDLIASLSPAWINYLLFQKKLKSQGDKFICVSNFIAEQALKNGFHENKIIQHYIGIDVEKYTAGQAEKDQRIVLHVARLVEKKGTSVLLNAIKLVRKECEDIRVVVIGDGPLLLQLKLQTAELGLQDNVIFTGALQHNVVMEWMRRASILVLPSLTANSGDAEGLGMVILEASASGVPVIGTNHGGIPEAVIDGKTGFLVRERDHKQLADRISFLLKNESERYLFGKQAREFVSSKFNLVEQTKKLEKIYQDVIDGQ